MRKQYSKKIRIKKIHIKKMGKWGGGEPFKRLRSLLSYF